MRRQIVTLEPPSLDRPVDDGSNLLAVLARLMALIDKGIIPVIYWEADWESRLEHIADIPYGKIIYHLSNTNFERAWDVLGGKVCLAGNVPNVMRWAARRTTSRRTARR